MERKADSSPVTVADREAEALIVTALRAIDRDIPVVAEEAVAAGTAPREGGDRFWLVDPLDGTREFIGQTDEFTVNIGLVEDGAPVLGAVHAPALGETYGGLTPGVVWRSGRSGTRRAISTRPVPVEGPVVLSSRRHGDRDPASPGCWPAWRLPGTGPSAARSSSAFSPPARATSIPATGETNEWDTAAGHAVLLAAGGSVRTIDGGPLRYGKAGFRNPEFIARGRG